jgi:hypothetical protein
MAKCDEGYICHVCGKDVADITDSDLYLRYVTGMLDPEILHTTPERHIRCNPVLAQFIVHADFEQVEVVGDFDKAKLDLQTREARERLVTAGWLRLSEIKETLKSGELSMHDYPLPAVREKLRTSN